MNILVTGAAGFVGSFLSEALVSHNYFVIGIDNFFRGKKSNLISLSTSNNFKFVEMDLSDSSNVDELKQIIADYKITTIYHLAAINGTLHFYDKSLFVLDQNIRITANLLNALNNSCVNKIIYTSSSEVYGEPFQVPTPETHPILLNPEANRDSYASSKAICEFYIRLFCEQYKIEYFILRLFNLYGPRMDNTKYGQVVPEFIDKVNADSAFSIIGDGTQTRSFCYIKDAINILLKFCLKSGSGIFNVGRNQEITILKLAAQIHKILNAEFNPSFLPARPNDHQRRCPDITKLLNFIGEIKFTPLESGLELVHDFYRGAGK